MNENQNSKFGDLEKYRITSQTKFDTVEPLITIENIPYAIKGGFSLLTGVQKSGKTTVLKIMIEKAFMTKIYEGYDDLGINSVVKNDGSVIYFNNEMYDSDIEEFRNKICKNLHLSSLPDNLHIFHFAVLFPEETLKFIEQVLERAEDAYLVFIDGLADLLKSVNNEEDSNFIIQTLQNLASKYKVAIVGVVHENRGNKSTRGHLGQQAERKCFASISVSKNKDKQFFTITSSLNRSSADFEDINYHYNDSGKLERIDKTNEKVKSSNELSESIALARVIFNEDEVLTEKELKTRLKEYFAPTIESDTKQGKDNAARNKGHRTIANWLRNIMTTAGAGNYTLHKNLESL